MSHLHRHEDGLCAACGKGATRLALFTIKQIDDHLNHFGIFRKEEGGRRKYEGGRRKYEGGSMKYEGGSMKEEV